MKNLLLVAVIVSIMPGRGIIPDHEVKPSPQQIIAGDDPVKAYTINLIRDQ